MGHTPIVSVERLIPAPAEEIFDLLADPSQHPILDGSGTVHAARDGNPQRLELGSTFGMDMRAGPFPYRIKNQVVEYEPPRRIAWRHWGRHRWRWELEPADGGTLVRETFDHSTAISPRALELLGYPQRNRAGMEATLERLEQHFAQG